MQQKAKIIVTPQFFCSICFNPKHFQTQINTHQKLLTKKYDQTPTYLLLRNFWLTKKIYSEIFLPFFLVIFRSKLIFFLWTKQVVPCLQHHKKKVGTFLVQDSTPAWHWVGRRMRFVGGVVFEINRVGARGGGRGLSGPASVENSPGCPTAQHSHTKRQTWSALSN